MDRNSKGNFDVAVLPFSCGRGCSDWVHSILYTVHPMTPPDRLAWNAIMKRALAAFFLCLLLAPPASAGFDEGMAAYNRGDFSTAQREWRSLAENGDIQAQYMIGRIYFHHLQNYSEAAKWYTKAAEKGHAAAQYGLANMYRNGRGVPQDTDVGMKWHLKAAEGGDAAAQNHLGFMYYYGRGVPQIYAEAVKWHRRAAEQGHAISQYNLGNLIRSGKGVQQDYVEAYKWYNLAAAQGNDLARLDLERLAKKMTSAQIVEAEKLARDWLHTRDRAKGKTVPGG